MLYRECLIMVGIILNHENGALELNLEVAVVANNEATNLHARQCRDAPLGPISELPPAVNDSSFFLENPIAFDAQRTDWVQAQDDLVLANAHLNNLRAEERTKIYIVLETVHLFFRRSVYSPQLS